jgi:branched-chain amino acid transport system substrate-binding protein
VTLMHHKAVALLGLALVFGVTACGSTPTALPTPTASPVTTPTGDGVLRIGTLLPDKGAESSIAQAEVAAVELAVVEINAAGGYGGVPVELYHRNSGDPTTTTPELALDALIAKGVDVVIGPSSAELIDRLAPAAQAANVVLVSPSAVDATLPSGGLVFRLAGSSSSSAVAVAHSIAEKGASRIAYLHSAGDEAFGDQLALAIAGTGSPRALPFLPPVGSIDLDLTITDDIDGVAAEVAAATPDAIVVSVSDSAAAADLLKQLVAAGVPAASLWLAPADAVSYSGDLKKGTLEGATAVVVGARPDADFAARIRQSDPAVRRYDFAAEAYDATVVAALGAITRGDDGGASIALGIPAVTHGGIPCTSVGECVAVLADRSDINYNGITGVDLGANGYPAMGAYSLLTYDSKNELAFVGVVSAQ